MDMSTSGYWPTRDGDGMELSPQVDNDPQGMEKGISNYWKEVNKTKFWESNK